MNLADAISDSAAYLASPEALASLARDPYWPKWHSPWWHMTTLWELGEAARIPVAASEAMVAALAALPVRDFPLTTAEWPPGADPHHDAMCHCAVGTIAQVLAATGRAPAWVDAWAEAWMVRYQMADGGLNCDDTAYAVRGECASSMVGTIAGFEAMLAGDPGTWSASRTAFVERAAGFLRARALVHGSPSAHNASERESAAAWGAPCFPRFYFYDVLRGLAALVRWAAVTGQPLPREVTAPVVAALEAQFPDGEIRVARQPWAAGKSRTRGNPQRTPASRFALLEVAGALGAVSPALTRQWAAVRAAAG